MNIEYLDPYGKELLSPARLQVVAGATLGWPLEPFNNGNIIGSS